MLLARMAFALRLSPLHRARRRLRRKQIMLCEYPVPDGTALRVDRGYSAIHTEVIFDRLGRPLRVETWE